MGKRPPLDVDPEYRAACEALTAALLALAKRLTDDPPTAGGLFIVLRSLVSVAHWHIMDPRRAVPTMTRAAEILTADPLAGDTAEGAARVLRAIYDLAHDGG